MGGADRYEDILSMSPMVVGAKNVDRIAVDSAGQAWISVKGAAYVRLTYETGAFTANPSAFALTDWRSYWQQVLGYKAGALTQLWHCPWSSDFVGQFDYSNSLGGGTNTDVSGTDAPGVRVANCLGATGGAFVQMGSPGAFLASPCIVTDVRLKRWAVVYRVKLVTATPDANTRLMFGLQVNASTKLGIGSIGPLSTTVLASVSGGAGATFTAGTANSTKAADANNYVWIVMYHDLTNVKGNVDAEAADFIVTPSSNLTAGQPAVPFMINFPAGGVRSESFNIDKAAIFTEL